MDGARFQGKPTLWNAVNGKSSPGLTSIGLGETTDGVGERKTVCVTGAEDGSVTLFELKQAF